jgi:hypothetical protein
MDQPTVIALPLRVEPVDDGYEIMDQNGKVLAHVAIARSLVDGAAKDA